MSTKARQTSQLVSSVGVSTITDLNSSRVTISGVSTFQNSINIGTAGTTAFFDVSTGNVGIGTDISAQKLEIYNKTPNSSGGILVRNVLFSNSQDNPYLIAGTNNWDGSTVDWGTYGFQHRIKSDVAGNPRVTIDNVNGEAFCVTNNSRVGIGTDNPYARNHIEINGNAGAGSGSAAALWLKNANQTANNSATIFFGNNSSQPAGAINFIHKDYSTNAGDISFDTRANGSTYAERVRISAGGSFGIGTNDPTSKLQIGDGNVSSDNVITLGKRVASSQTNLPVIGHTSTDGDDSSLGLCATSSSGRIIFYTGNDSGGFGAGAKEERVRITSGGGVGIATAFPQEKLHVAGNVRVSNASNAAQYLTVSYEGLDFSSTGAGSSTAASTHLFDDYEEGTWTPRDENNSSIASGLQGTYIKCGNIVIAKARRYQGTGFSIPNGIIRGLPFAGASTNVSGTWFFNGRSTTTNRFQTGTVRGWTGDNATWANDGFEVSGWLVPSDSTYSSFAVIVTMILT